MKVSIRDVAARAGVSTGTVSNVLNGRSSVRPDLAEAVRSAARELKFEPNRAAAQLRGRPARIVAALVPDLNNPFFSSLLASLEECVRADGFSLIVASANESPAEELDRLAALLAWKPAGLMIVPCADDFEGRDLVAQRRAPFVVADRIPTTYRGDAVTIDNVDAGRLAAECLVNRGHRNILVVASTLQLRNIRERCEGVREVFRTCGLEGPQIVEVGPIFDPAADTISASLAEEPRATAILALTAIATLGVLVALQRRGLHVPRDISVVGFDDYPWMEAMSPPLTSIRQPVAAMGQAVWDRLRARIEGDEPTATRISLLSERIDRKSVSAPPGA